jgi:hypothetical protein
VGGKQNPISATNPNKLPRRKRLAHNKTQTNPQKTHTPRPDNTTHFFAVFF